MLQYASTGHIKIKCRGHDGAGRRRDLVITDTLANQVACVWGGSAPHFFISIIFYYNNDLTIASQVPRNRIGRC